MRSTVLDDRSLARAAYQAAGHEAEDDDVAADIAFGRAVVALRVQGATVGREALQVLRADIDAIFAQPAELARARSFAASRQPARSAQPTVRLALAG